MVCHRRGVPGEKRGLDTGSVGFLVFVTEKNYSMYQSDAERGLFSKVDNTFKGVRDVFGGFPVLY